MNKMRNLNVWLITSIIVAGTAGAATGQIIYVDTEATGANNGTSWADAYTYLQDALALAATGDEIWVAEGVYRPDEDTAHPTGTGDRKATFQLKNGVALKGGYAGIGEPNPDDRDVDGYGTILSGDLNGDDGPDFANNGENSQHVVTGSGTDVTAILDGVTITSGYADTWLGGGGMVNRSGSPTFSNCVFSKNWANKHGGGMWNDGSSTPTLTNCEFRDNRADDKGGGIHNKESSPTLTGCTLVGNSAGVDGGGMSNVEGSDSALNGCTFVENSTIKRGGGMYNSYSNPTMTNCTLNENSANESGGGMYNGASKPILTNCTFMGNSALTGGGMLNRDPDGPILTNCTFSENSASKNGGGIASTRGANPTLIDCTFSKNSAGEDGGGMENYRDTSPTLTRCTFSMNSAKNGGGLHNKSRAEIGASLTLTDCTFSENTASECGGGVFNERYSSSTLTDCRLNQNSADETGGGMYNREAMPELTNCTFGDNTASDGGGMYNHYCNPTLTNCTFTGNRAEVEGGGGITNNFSSPTITNCMFSGNSAAKKGGGIQAWFWTARLTNCAFVGNVAEEGGGLYSEGGQGLIVNCTFTQNHASRRGGGTHNRNEVCPQITNCILWGDTPDEISGGTPDITCSDVQGGTGQPWLGVGCIDIDPLFSDADGRLSAGSLCINAGSNAALPQDTTDLDGDGDTTEPIPLDLDRNPRIFNGIVDMGAYESQVPSNQPPVADAGPDDIGFAWFDGIAEVTLDGSGSSDPDGDALTYRWTWAIDCETCEATGMSPTIELPIGEHVIELIVNDGTQDSVPDEVIVEVFGPVPVDDLVRLTYGRLRFDRRTGLMSMDISMTNTSDETIISPIGLVIESISDPSVTLANSDGITHDGKPYIDLSGLLGDGQLDPGESVSTRISFNNPSRVRFTFEPSVRGMILP